MTPVLIMPGIGGSGPLHWQSRWEASEPAYRRVHVPDWDHPELPAWLAALDAAVKAVAPAPVIVAHSLGCLAVAHWVAGGGQARAALLVAPPDPASPQFPAVARSFAPVPTGRFGFPARVVASRNDPYGSVAFAQCCADTWGAAFSDVGNAGHINADSGLGDWTAGRQLLTDLLR